MNELVGLQKLIDKVFMLNEELIQLRGWKYRHQLGSPAAEQELAQIESTYSIQLPRDYRAFLLMHNGWRGFEGQQDLLSTAQMRDAEIKANLDDIRALAKNEATSVAGGFVIQACATSPDILFYDLTGYKQLGGGPSLVRWEYREIARYDTFYAYLQETACTLEEMIADARSRLR